VNEFGITHIAFDLKAGEPQWVSPNATISHPKFFQDMNGASQYNSVLVLSNVRRRLNFHSSARG
jgi:hypothetical protein